MLAQQAQSALLNTFMANEAFQLSVNSFYRRKIGTNFFDKGMSAHKSRIYAGKTSLQCKDATGVSHHIGRKNGILGNFLQSDPILDDPDAIGKAVYSHADWAQQCISVDGEYSYWIDTIEGELPLDLIGSLFRNGPARFDRGGQKYASMLDGDGYINRFIFPGDGTCHYSGRFVRTREFQEEESKGQVCWRGTFGTQVIRRSHPRTPRSISCISSRAPPPPQLRSWACSALQNASKRSQSPLYHTCREVCRHALLAFSASLST